jgi:hypothetical protein
MRLLVIIGLALCCSVAQAEENTSDELRRVSDELCASYASLAESMMEAHQSGVSLSEALAVTDTHKVVRNIVVKAYDSPRYRTDGAKLRAVEKFRDSIHVRCLKEASQTDN